MKQKLRNLINALLIGEQMPNHGLKAHQLRSFFEEVDQIPFEDEHDPDVIRISIHAAPTYRFVYINDQEGIEINIEAHITNDIQTLLVKKNIIPEEA